MSAPKDPDGPSTLRGASGEVSSKTQRAPSAPSAPLTASTLDLEGTAIEIRVARTEAEREAIFRLRHDVYVTEMGEYRSEAKDGMLRDPSDDQPNARHVYAALADAGPDHGKVIAALRYHVGGSFTREERVVYDLGRFMDVVPQDRFAILSRFCAVAEHRQDVPMRLLLASLPFTREDDVELLFCDCQPHLVSLYQRLGFRSYAAVYSDVVASVLVPLVLLRGDAEHFVKVHSPLAARDVPPASVAVASRIHPLVRGGAVKKLDGTEIPWETVYASVQDVANVGTVGALGAPEAGASIFAGLTIDEVRSILDAGIEMRLSRGDRLMRRGQPTRTFYVVIRGALEEREGSRVVGHLGRGDVAGEVSLLVPGQRRISDVFAVEDDVVVLGIGEKAFRRLATSRSPTAAVFALNLCRALARKMAMRSVLASGPVDA